ncbi:hypothetical protein [Acinetobacter sp. TGL-Y2]|uniref:hypothetical protein n=1 Tax=Acinetobacter sp. TGL-Y2 TaxID=1407071 RepID=UPI000A735141|nr:hypothetical protein [Acinetobacter sp. TGL-Y2]
MLLDFLQMHDLASGLSIIPDELWHLLHLAIWCCAVRNLLSDYTWVNRWLRRVCLALMLWLGSTVLLVVIILNVHSQMGWTL